MSRSPEITAITTFDIVLFSLILSNRCWQRFTSISYFNSGTRVQCPYQNSIALDVHYLSRTRFSGISSYMFTDGQNLLGRDSHSLLSLIKTTLLDEFGVVVFWHHQYLITHLDEYLWCGPTFYSKIKKKKKLFKNK